MASFEHIVITLALGVSVLAGWQAFKTISITHNNKKRKVIENVFLWMAIGIMAWVLGEFIWDVQFLISGYYKYPSIADAFYVFGYTIMLPAMVFFWLHNAGKLTFREHMLFLFAAFAVMALTVGILFFIVAPAESPKSLIEIFLDFFYPIGSALLFLSTFSITAVADSNLRHERKNRPLLYLAQGIFFSFIGDVFYSISTWRGAYGVLGALSDLSFLLSYVLFAFGFYLFNFKFCRMKLSGAKDL